MKQYHIFISHAWDYNNQYNTIQRWLNDATYFTWTDYSVPITKPLHVSGKNDLKQRLENRIAMSSCMIVISGMYATYSEWIDYEIDIAVKYKKPIIGIRPWNQQRVPIKIQQNATTLVGWNSASVISAIRQFAL